MTTWTTDDELAKSRNKHIFVIPAKAGIQGYQGVTILLDPGFHRSDDFLRDHHRWILAMVKKRINDGALLRLIGKWLNAGVMDDDILSYPEKGTPQGGVISPMLANIYLHYALDTWYVQVVKPRLRGRSFLVRFADDCAPRRRGRKATMAA